MRCHFATLFWSCVNRGATHDPKHHTASANTTCRNFWSKKRAFLKEHFKSKKKQTAPCLKKIRPGNNSDAQQWEALPSYCFNLQKESSGGKWTLDPHLRPTFQRAYWFGKNLSCHMLRVEDNSLMTGAKGLRLHRVALRMQNVA